MTNRQLLRCLFTDQELDPETGLYNYVARLYDPVIGRFISPDPIVPDPFDPQTLNRYSYCRNNPLIYVDPTGNFYDAIGMDWSSWTGYDFGYDGGESGSGGLYDGNGAALPTDDSSGTSSPGTTSDGLTPKSIYIDSWIREYLYGKRYINPKPGGPNEPTITFKNDNPKNPTPNQPVTNPTAKMIEDAVKKSGVKSININSTTGGKHSKYSRHYSGQAADINEINDLPVDDEKNVEAAKGLQKAFNEQPNIRENYGPALCTKTDQYGNRTKKPNQQKSHKDHIHVSGQY